MGRIGVFKILLSIKNIFVHLRSSIKMIFLLAMAIILILGLVFCFYKVSYKVTLNGEFIGYASSKADLQDKINTYIEGEEGTTVAFVDIETLPEYEMCFLKRSTQTNDEEIFNKAISAGTTYYQYYAIIDEDEEKYYVATKDNAENIIDQLKEKNSRNKNDLMYTELYTTETKELATEEDAVDGLYEKPVSYYTGGYTLASVETVYDLSQYGVSFVKPVVSGYTITSRYGPRWGSTHSGLDVAAPTGTPIYAAEAGTVIVSSYSTTGYGNYIIIEHNSSVKTLYGHCSSLVAKQGQYVAQGELIGYVGSTGNSTGPHLHLEVIINGVKLNPQHYLY